MADGAEDGRHAVRVQHRGALLAAAGALIAERDGTRFTVDELAGRAGVARRTVFNHFGSVDGVLLALAEQVVGARVDDLLARTPPAAADERGPGAAFRFVSGMLTSIDLAAVIVEVERVLRGLDEARASLLVEQTFTRVAAALTAEILRRDPDADPLESEVTVGALVAAVQVVARRWTAEPGDRTAPGARAAFDAQLDRGIRRLRAGFDG